MSLLFGVFFAATCVGGAATVHRGAQCDQVLERHRRRVGAGAGRDQRCLHGSSGDKCIQQLVNLWRTSAAVSQIYSLSLHIHTCWLKTILSLNNALYLVSFISSCLCYVERSFREFGAVLKELDLLDEQPLSGDQIRAVCGSM